MSQCPTVPGRFQVRRDTATNWTDNNPRLADGEMGYETNTGRMKIGDGMNLWRDLPYFPSASTLYGIIDGGLPNSDYTDTPAIIDCGGIN
jgi:hypothetical protein